MDALKPEYSSVHLPSTHSEAGSPLPLPPASTLLARAGMDNFGRRASCPPEPLATRSSSNSSRSPLGSARTRAYPSRLEPLESGRSLRPSSHTSSLMDLDENECVDEFVGSECSFDAVDLPPRPRRMSYTVHPIAHVANVDSSLVRGFMLSKMSEQEEKDKAFNRYLQQHTIGPVVECLITACGLERPDDIKAYLREKLQFLQTYEGAVSWDLLIPPEIRPAKRPLPYWMIKPEEEDDRPTPEMYKTAYEYNRRRVLQPVVKAWFEWYRNRIRAKTELRTKLDMALRHYHAKLRIKYFAPWVQFRLDMIEKRRQVIQRMMGRRKGNLLKQCFGCWRQFAIQARATASYFKDVVKASAVVKDDMAQANDLFSTLQYATRLEIFTVLDLRSKLACMQVCRAWREVAQDPTLWNEISFTELDRLTTDDAVARLIAKYRPFLSRINMRYCNRVTSNAMGALGQCRNLQDLNLSDCHRVRDVGIKMIAEGCPGLVYLNLTCCAITDLSLQYIARRCENLSYLSVACCSSLTDAGAQFLARASCCDKLYWLDLSGCVNITDQGVAAVAQRASNLSTILLNDMPQLLDEGLLAVSQHCPYLVRLGLRCCDSLTDQALEYVGAYAMSLSEIEITENRHMTNAGITALANVPNLKHVVIQQCPKIRESAGSCLAKHSIRYLDISYNNHFGDHIVRSIGQGSAAPLSVEVAILAQLTRLTDTGMRHFARGCTGLQHLDLTGCTQLTDGSLTVVVTALPELTYLNLKGCSKIGDATLQSIQSYGMDKLQWLDLSDCVSLTDIGIEALGGGCPLLRTLNLSNVLATTDNCMQQLAYGCPRLSWLALTGCGSITDKGVLYLVGACRRMRSLHLYGCQSVTNASITQACSTWPALRHLSLGTDGAVTRDKVLQTSPQACFRIACRKRPQSSFQLTPNWCRSWLCAASITT
eukprot:TRINITY_DN10834_c0_g1_i6.p1 TRINITY_DN10834_c0_g1~~TRINITY_DN10834_c0_g1_i6.p1  ORF type:complete len:936 (+),score=119.08 TRINITY_DN10834_c0_g1_i6:148-2955(+)